MPLERFTHIAIRVGDLERSLGFYRDALGFVEQSRYDGNGGPSALMIGDLDAAISAIFLERDGVTVELQTLAGDDPTVSTTVQRGLSHIGFKVTNLQAVMAQLERAGASVIPSSHYRNTEFASEVCS